MIPEWELTDAGSMALPPSDEPTDLVEDIRTRIQWLRVDDVPLRDLLLIAAVGCHRRTVFQPEEATEDPRWKPDKIHVDDVDASQRLHYLACFALKTLAGNKNDG